MKAQSAKIRANSWHKDIFPAGRPESIKVCWGTNQLAELELSNKHNFFATAAFLL
jgi:hypothetical protein